MRITVSTPVENPKTFISYSHDSQKHQDRVRALADRLRVDGIDVQIDQYAPAPSEGWPMWMDKQIRTATFVLLVCTDIYLRRVERREEPGKGRGVLWEADLIYNSLYPADLNVQKFIPILFADAEPSSIPLRLRCLTHYRVDTEDGYENLYRHLTNQPRYQLPELGKPTSLPTIAPQHPEASALRSQWKRRRFGAIVVVIAAVAAMTLVGWWRMSLTIRPSIHANVPKRDIDNQVEMRESLPEPQAPPLPDHIIVKQHPPVVKAPPPHEWSWDSTSFSLRDSLINLTNVRSNSYLCANTYVFAANGQMIACCSCLVFSNGLMSYSVRHDLLNNVLDYMPLAITIKVFSSKPVNKNTCDAASPTYADVVDGVVVRVIPNDEAPFSSELSVTEVNTITSLCKVIQNTGNGRGICEFCRTR